MKRNVLLFIVAIFCSFGFATNHVPNAWINEFHYDNTSGDEGEALEIVIEDVESFNLELLTLEFYNGSNGTVYKSINLKDSIACAVEDIYSFFWIRYAGIQNGSPDGFALSYNGQLIQFISYEGELEATEGNADGQTSEDILVAESGTTEIGQSLQLTGTGNAYGDFTWMEPSASTFCGINTGQSFLVTSHKEIEVKNTLVFAQNGHLVVCPAAQELMRVYDVSGRLIKEVNLTPGEHRIPIDVKGLVLVKLGTKVEKLVLR